MNLRTSLQPKTGTTLRRCLCWVALIALVECAIFNLPFWESFSASTDSASYLNAMGSGLQRQSDGSLKVTDPSNAYLDTVSDGTSPFLRLDGIGKDMGQATRDGKTKTMNSFHVRVEINGKLVSTTSVSTDVPASLYLRVGRGSAVRVWIMEEQGSIVNCTAVRANIHVPFRFDWWRVAFMAALAALFEAWRPGSKLWRVTLDTKDGAQRKVFAGYALIVVAMASYTIIKAVLHTPPLRFHDPGNYTYDFDQYGHLADSLIHGRTWLDLPVPDALKKAANPYDPSIREALLDRGVTPIYWDYAFFKGHWYTYFGVLPALLLFVPYRLVSRLVVPGGRMLPSAAAVAFFMCLFLIFAALLVIRIIESIAPKTSLAAASMAVTLLVLGSNAAYLIFRMNFYSVPFAASLMFSVIGLWFWFGAGGKTVRHAVTIGSSPAVSWPHLAAGCACVAANLGCRPPFALTALLGIPLFWPQLKALAEGFTSGVSTRLHCSGIHHQPTHSGHAHDAIVVVAAVLVPTFAMVLPICTYNFSRFGSPINFGDHYQLTVADMTSMRNPVGNWLPTLGYYLFLPLRFTAQFPFIALNPMPLGHWSYTEPMIGGIITLCPLLLTALATPLICKRTGQRRCCIALSCCLFLAFAQLLIDTVRGGLAWRYMTDSGWLFALAALPTMLAALPSSPDIRMTDDLQMSYGTGLWNRVQHWIRPTPHHTAAVRVKALRLLIALLLVFSMAMTLLSMFVPGRDDALQRNDQVLYHAMQSWFSLL